MVLALIGVLVAQSADVGPADPAWALAMAIGELAGATHRDLAVEIDASVTPAEAAALSRELAGAGLFRLVPRENATLVVRLQREGEAVAATVLAAEGRFFGTVREPWPPSQSPAGHSESDLSSRLLAYVRQRLFVSEESSPPRLPPSAPPRAPDAPPANPAPGVDVLPDPQRQAAPFPGWGWAAGYTVAPPLPRPDQSWAIFRGSGERITDLELARLVDDEALAARIRARRNRTRLLWAAGFGAAAAMSLAAGASLASEPDTRTPGLGLLGFAAVSGGLSLLFPLVGGGHVLSSDQASTLVESYNRDLRARLGLE